MALEASDAYEEINRLSNQCDELLGALKRANEFISEINNAGGKYSGLYGDIVRDSYEVSADIRAIISKAEQS